MSQGGRSTSQASAHGVVATRTHFSTTGPRRRRGTVISFRLRSPGRVELVVRAAGGSCAVIGQRSLAGHGGLNRVPFDGRLRGRRLEPGRYTISVVVIRGGRPSEVGKVAIQVVRSRARIADRTARVPVAPCAPAATVSLPASAGGLPAFAALAESAAQSAPHASAKRPPVQTAGFTPPKLPAPPVGGSGEIISIRWGDLARYGLLGLAALMLIAALTQFARRQWPS
jgi:hypothetical protein